VKRNASLLTLRGIQGMLGIPRGVITRLIGAGVISPQRGPRKEYLFTFRDVVLLRTAHGLHRARIAPRRILQSLEHLKATLPVEMPLSSLRITAVGGEVAVHEQHGPRSAETGQYLIDFELEPQAQGTVKDLALATSKTTSAEQLFDAATMAEGLRPDEAVGAYRQAIGLAPDFCDAHINLSALLIEQERYDQAVEACDRGLSHHADCPELHFNRALALEEAHRYRQALMAYERCLELQPDFARAHFNLAGLFERAGNVQKALQHFNAYRRLTR
jgi:tetratricopeptide (TPR) repeat protein